MVKHTVNLARSLSLSLSRNPSENFKKPISNASLSSLNPAVVAATTTTLALSHH